MFCKNCKYFQKTNEFISYENQMKYGLCTHPKSKVSVKLNTGKRKYLDARIMRDNNNKCGSNANYYIDINDSKSILEPKERICINCKYFKLNESWYTKINKIEYGLCTHPNNIIIDKVTGFVEYPCAENERNSYNNRNSCGMDGNLFEQNNDIEKIKSYKQILNEYDLTPSINNIPTIIQQCNDTSYIIHNMIRTCKVIIVFMSLFFILILNIK